MKNDYRKILFSLIGFILIFLAVFTVFVLLEITASCFVSLPNVNLRNDFRLNRPGALIAVLLIMNGRDRRLICRGHGTDYCKQNNVKLLLTGVPYYQQLISGPDGKRVWSIRPHREIEKVALKYGLRRT